MYINRNEIIEVLQTMQNFESRLKELYSDFNYDLHENLGRRNMLLSTIQEIETARVLSKKFDQVLSDGAPGKPDVVICDIQKELECKLTSGSKSSGSVSFSLQTDYATLKNKESLDYMFILARPSFDAFCVLHFEGLTIDDYFPPAPGSRGKSRMRKETAMKKAKALVGEIIDVSSKNISDLQDELKDRSNKFSIRLANLNERLENCTENAVKKRENIERMITNEKERFAKASKKIADRITYWENNQKYSFGFELVNSPIEKAA